MKKGTGEPASPREKERGPRHGERGDMAAEPDRSAQVRLDAERLEPGWRDHVAAGKDLIHRSFVLHAGFFALQQHAPRQRKRGDDDQHDRDGGDRRIDIVMHPHPHEARKRNGVDAGDEQRNADFLPGEKEGHQRRHHHAETNVGKDDFEHALKRACAKPARGEVDAPVDLREATRIITTANGVIMTTCAIVTPNHVS